MARLNIEPTIWTDPRFMRLAQLVGDVDKAMGILVRSWMLAQRYWFKRELIPDHAWQGSAFPDALFECGLAERRENGVYIRGSEENFSWYFERLAAASSGGKASAKRPRDAKGRLLSKQTPSDSSEVQRSSSSSSSKELNTAAVSSKRARKRQEVVEYKSAEELKAGLATDAELLDSWRKLYPEEEYRKRELVKAWEFYRINERKRPTTISGWKRAIGSWLERGWSRHIAGVPSIGGGKAFATNGVRPISYPSVEKVLEETKSDGPRADPAKVRELMSKAFRYSPTDKEGA